jgi:topoisomerase IA-like protein
MASRKSAKATDVEQKLVVLAEQLGTFLGRAQAKADALLRDEAVRARVAQVRSGAAALLAEINRASQAVRKAAAAAAAAGPATAAKPAAKKTPRPSRGPVDAPGKKHRKPPPQERVDKHATRALGNHQPGAKTMRTSTRGPRR